MKVLCSIIALVCLALLPERTEAGVAVVVGGQRGVGVVRRGFAPVFVRPRAVVGVGLGYGGVGAGVGLGYGLGINRGLGLGYGGYNQTIVRQQFYAPPVQALGLGYGTGIVGGCGGAAAGLGYAPRGLGGCQCGSGY